MFKMGYGGASTTFVSPLIPPLNLSELDIQQSDSAWLGIPRKHGQFNV